MEGQKIEFWYNGRIEWGIVLSEHEFGYDVNLLGIGQEIYVQKSFVVE